MLRGFFPPRYCSDSCDGRRAGPHGGAWPAGGNNSRFNEPLDPSPDPPSTRLWSSRLRRVPLTSRSMRAVAGWFFCWAWAEWAWDGAWPEAPPPYDGSTAGASIEDGD